ncbi:hypothetical protein EUTSA_v10017540mg [Eutrema salsugineum]|uniref:S-protein homolog n=1 Tax=Eutrema salsugineum TaxID=72664 RepID=V4LKY8_EUTSA|nr:hypothetical protein EUTSA_v10017540mg [Eutrema salsugineum]
MNNIFHYLFLIIILCVRLNEALDMNCHKNTVVFQNHLFTSRSILKVHCKSKNDDLGEHFVEFEGPSYNFSFHDSVIIFLSTKWDCNLWKGANMEYHQSIRAYVAELIPRCGKLYAWDVRDDAIYLSKDDEPEEPKYQWIKD